MTPSEQIDKKVAELDDWRGELYARLRKLINEADAELEESWKWGTAVWVHKGNVCALGAFKDHVKLNFFKGASLADPDHLFNSGLDAKDSRSIDFNEDNRLDEEKLRSLILEAVAHDK